MPQDNQPWCPFRPTADNLKNIAQDVAEIGAIQKKAVEKNKHLTLADRVAHQYQIAGGKVLFRAADALPEPLREVGIFRPGGESIGIGRISTGLGTPHLETNPDFLGLRVAFQTKEGRRVDFLAINDPTSPADNHKDFMDVLRATGEAAGAEVPFVGDWGAYNSLNLIAEQMEFGKALKEGMGLIKAGRTLLHLTKQTSRTFRSSTAYQTYWTGVEEIGGRAGKFTFVPAQDENKPPNFRPGERYLSEEWKKRQQSGDVRFLLYWISYLDEEKTPTKALTAPWEEQHKQLAGAVTFTRVDPASEEAKLWAILASEMGANPGNWIHDKGNTINEAATEFGAARKIAYRLSQEGRGALEPKWYGSVFETGQIASDLAEELKRRRETKQKANHMSQAP
jgi:hypothetical protein